MVDEISWYDHTMEASQSYEICTSHCGIDCSTAGSASAAIPGPLEHLIMRVNTVSNWPVLQQNITSHHFWTGILKNDHSNRSLTTGVPGLLVPCDIGYWDSSHKHFVSSYAKLLQNTQCSNAKNGDQITSEFCTCHNSWAVVTCAKFWHDWMVRIKIRAKWMLIIF